MIRVAAALLAVVLAVAFSFQALADQAPVSSKYTEGTFDQIVDHSPAATARASSQTFKQRYFLNSNFAAGPNAPVLFELCGESRCGVSENPASPLLQFAKTLGAHVIVLEHRYYGESMPVADLSTENLKYLTSDNALADAADFERFAQRDLHLSGKWIVVGGSYSGVLSASFRLRYPDLVVGALASSAPVNVQEILPGMDENTSELIGPACTRIVQSFTTQLEARVSSPDWPKAKKFFGMEKVQDDRDFFNVLGDAVSYFPRNSKYCAQLQQTPTFAVFAKLVSQALSEQAGITAYEDSFTSLIPVLNDRQVGSKQWVYQTCTEFGYFQIAAADPAKRIHSKLVDKKFFADVCRELFGITKLPDFAAINQKIYSPLLTSSSNILFTNGSADVWKALGISEENHNATNSHDVYAFIDGGLHCSDLSRSGNPTESLLRARKMFIDNAQKWLAE